MVQIQVMITIMSRFMERNTTLYPLPGGRSLLAYEPCNTASNIAYYHMVTAMARKPHWKLTQAEVTSSLLVLQTINQRSCTITKKAPNRAFSWLKAATTAFTFKTLLRHYAKWTLTPR